MKWQDASINAFVHHCIRKGFCKYTEQTIIEQKIISYNRHKKTNSVMKHFMKRCMKEMTAPKGYLPNALK